MSDDADESIVASVLQGNVDAYERLVRRYRRSALLVATAVLNDADDAEDICQDAFVQAYAKLGTCRAPGKFGAWLLQIVRNRALNHKRAIGRRRTTPLDDLPPISSGVLADAQANRSELRERLTRALAEVSIVQREVVLLHGLEGWSHNDIARALGISEDMSRRHLSDARRILRAVLTIDE